MPPPPPRLSDIAPPTNALLAVLTTRPACEPFSLEVAEFVGDAVLDYLVSVYLHTELRQDRNGILLNGLDSHPPLPPLSFTSALIPPVVL